MEQKKKFRLGKYSIVIGIGCGFAFLFSLLSILDGDMSRSVILGDIGLIATSLSMFLLATEESKKKTCSKV